jgi:hypothetical protein
LPYADRSIFVGPNGHGHSVQDAVRTNAGDEIASATGMDVTLRAGLKLGGRVDKPLPSLRKASRRTDTGDRIAGATS